MARLSPYKAALERRDLGLLAGLAVLIPLAWALLLGWDASHAAAGHDSLSQLFPQLKDLAAARGDWKAMLYRPELLGGVVVHNVFGSLPIHRLLAFLGLRPLDSFNAGVFFFQLLLGFLGARTALDLGALLSAERPARAFGWTAGVAAGLLCAFAPATGWRLIYGHFNIVLGLLAPLSAFALLAAALNASLSLTLAAAAFTALAHCFQSFGHQLVLYGALFGLPFFAALLLPARRSGQAPAAPAWPARLAPVALVFAAALLWSLPVFSGMLRHALSSDAGRSLGGPPVVFSELVGTSRDWLGSLAWSPALGPAGREPTRLHETNYPLGPLVLLLALLPWSYAAWGGLGLLGAAFLLSLAAGLAFGSGLQPLAGVLLALVPPLKSFRIPARAVLPALALLPGLGAGALLSRLKGAWKPGALLWVLPAGAALFFAPPWAREAGAWGLAALAAAAAALKPERARLWSAEAFLILLTLASAAAFKERLFGYWSETVLVDQPRAQGDELRRQRPELASALTRILFSGGPTPFQMNRGYALGVSVLDGHWAPQRRFLELYFGLRGEAPVLSATSLQLRESDPAFPVLRWLYNVRFAGRVGKGTLTTEELDPTPGEAWFSAAVERHGSIAELAAALRKAEARQAPGALLVADGDPAAARAPASVDPACARAKVLSVEAPHGAQTLRLKVTSPAACPLTLATNFAELFEARSAGPDGSWSPLALYPAYGALMGMVVPAGAAEVEVTARPSVLGPPLLEALAGLALLAAAFALILRLESPEAASPAKEKKGKKGR